MKYIGHAILVAILLSACNLPATEPDASSQDSSVNAMQKEHEALRMHIEAVEAATYRWAAKSGLLEMMTDYEQRLSRRVCRLESLHAIAYSAYLGSVAQSTNTQTNSVASLFLKQEVNRMEESIQQAEDELTEYQRPEGIARVSPREQQLIAEVLTALLRRQMELTTRIMILESQYPSLTNAPPDMVMDIQTLNAETFDALKAPTGN